MRLPIREKRTHAESPVSVVWEAVIVTVSWVSVSPSWVFPFTVNLLVIVVVEEGPRILTFPREVIVIHLYAFVVWPTYISIVGEVFSAFAAYPAPLYVLGLTCKTEVTVPALFKNVIPLASVLSVALPSDWSGWCILR